jgi:hypothetical protein
MDEEEGEEEESGSPTPAPRRQSMMEASLDDKSSLAKMLNAKPESPSGSDDEDSDWDD